MIRQLYYWVTD